MRQQSLFFRTFADYENGFGDVSGEHWLGVTYQHLMTKDNSCTLKALLEVDVEAQFNLNLCVTPHEDDCNGEVQPNCITHSQDESDLWL